MTNIFMKQVRDIQRFSFLHPIKTIRSRIELGKFVKTIKNGSPSLGVLWNFADFIKYAERIYFTRNSKDFLYSSSEYKPGENGFIINRKDIGIVITCKLYSEDQVVGLDLEYKNSKLKTNYTFKEGHWDKDPDDYDEILIDRIIEIINNMMLHWLQECIRIKFNSEGYKLPNW